MAVPRRQGSKLAGNTKTRNSDSDAKILDPASSFVLGYVGRSIQQVVPALPAVDGFEPGPMAFWPSMGLRLTTSVPAIKKHDEARMEIVPVRLRMILSSSSLQPKSDRRRLPPQEQATFSKSHRYSNVPRRMISATEK